MIKRLKEMSLDELRVRGTQAISAWGERQFSKRSLLPGDRELLNLLDSGRFKGSAVEDLRDPFKSHRFFASFADPGATVAELRSSFPNSENETVAEADRILAGRFDLLGFSDLDFGDPIDWHREPVAHRSAPRLHWSRLNFLNPELVGDKKITWELNRHQYFLTLGRAYWLTRDEKYARAFVEHLESWMDANPPKWGINWASSLEVAFRSISWLWALQFFKDSVQVTPEVFVRAYKYLYVFARHIETYLSTYFSPNTHLTGEALGLFYLGTFLPEFKESARWREVGSSTLLDQLPVHVQPDGVYFEQSSYYHQYTTDFYLHFLVLLRLAEQPLPGQLETKLVQLLDHLMYITRPDGVTPLFGDDDGGRLVRLSSIRTNDSRTLLSIGAGVFNRSDYKFIGGVKEEALWLLGPNGLRELENLPAREPEKQSIAFESGGYYAMRDGWAGTSNYLFFDCGPHGVNNCGHAHADALSFELAVNGQAILVDPGTFTYTNTPQERNWFRGSVAHNALIVDDEFSSTPNGPFSWRSIANCRRDSWISTTEFDYISASHDGYLRLPDPVEHERSILFVKNSYWIVRDRVSARDSHSIKLLFHAIPGATLHGQGNVMQISLPGSESGLQLAAFAPGGVWSQQPGWVSPCYGKKLEAPIAGYSFSINGPSECLTVMIPQRDGEVCTVEQIEAVHGTALRINYGDRHDLLLSRTSGGSGSAKTERFYSDSDFALARFADREARMPDQVLLIRGQKFEVDGQPIETDVWN
jgi:hypothetical protein